MEKLGVVKDFLPAVDLGITGSLSHISIGHNEEEQSGRRKTWHKVDMHWHKVDMHWHNVRDDDYTVLFSHVAVQMCEI